MEITALKQLITLILYEWSTVHHSQVIVHIEVVVEFSPQFRKHHIMYILVL